MIDQLVSNPSSANVAWEEAWICISELRFYILSYMVLHGCGVYTSLTFYIKVQLSVWSNSVPSFLHSAHKLLLGSSFKLVSLWKSKFTSMTEYIITACLDAAPLKLPGDRISTVVAPDYRRPRLEASVCKVAVDLSLFPGSSLLTGDCS